MRLSYARISGGGSRSSPLKAETCWSTGDGLGDAARVIERAVALRTVEEQLERDYRQGLASGAEPMRLAVSHVEKHELVWIVIWDSEEYVRTRDRRFMLAGNGPYLVDRVDGGLHQIGVVSAVTDAWETDYRVRIRGLAVRTAVDDLHEEIRAVAAERGRIYAMHILRQRVPALSHAEVIDYVGALQNGAAPAHLVAISTRVLVEPLDPILRVTTIRRGKGRSRPLLFLDVDGPLNPYAAQPERRPEGYTTLRVPHGSGTTGGLLSRRRSLRVWLNPEHGQALLRLDYELCWATTWMDDANRWIGPVLGLPDLPFVEFGDALFQERPDGVHWKTCPLVDYAGGRPFAWVDDEQSDLDHAYVTAHHHGPGLLHHVNPRIGLREADFLALADFARSLETSRSTG